MRNRLDAWLVVVALAGLTPVVAQNNGTDWPQWRGVNRDGVTDTLYHTAMSPLVDRGLVVVHVGGHNNGALTAFDANTGAVR